MNAVYQRPNKALPPDGALSLAPIGRAPRA